MTQDQISSDENCRRKQGQAPRPPNISSIRPVSSGEKRLIVLAVPFVLQKLKADENMDMAVRAVRMKLFHK